ncbi:hypothetical protein [Clostridium sp.]|uniref:hypothetical protein n=1 Tax=Clostridium sp. TaxID=1506 RepID=UPI002FDE60C8
MCKDMSLELWYSPTGVEISNRDERTIEGIMNYAISLKDMERRKVISAFNDENAGLHDMGSEYVWKRTINRLKSLIIDDFGIEFVMEMLGRDINLMSNPEKTLSEVDIINLAADLGFIDNTARLLLMQQSELINHFSSPEASTSMAYFPALACVLYCTKYVLGYDSLPEFTFGNFRERLFNEQLPENDGIITLLETSAYFYRRITIRTLLSLIRAKQGGELDNVLNNFAKITPKLWSKLTGEDKWPIGNAYAEYINQGNKEVAAYIKSVLIKVKGFNYVPENLRSQTFIEAAKELENVHYQFNNFYNEPDAAKKLEALGTIPAPALGVCMTSILICKLGNAYGVSNAAKPILDRMLSNISERSWAYYLNEVLPTDKVVLSKLFDTPGYKRWLKIIAKYNLQSISVANYKVKRFINSCCDDKYATVKIIANDFIEGRIEEGSGNN